MPQPQDALCVLFHQLLNQAGAAILECHEARIRAETAELEAAHATGACWFFFAAACLCAVLAFVAVSVNLGGIL